MGNPGESSQHVRFGEFELDLRTREVWTNGDKFDLQEQPFHVLCVLLEKPGQLVTREELTRRLWPDGTFVDFEHALNRVIKRLREALDDSADEPRFIETLPRRGYRFIASVRQVSPSDQYPKPIPISVPDDSTSGQAQQSDASSKPNGRERSETPALRSWHRRAAFILIAAAIGCLAGWITYRLLTPPPMLSVVRTRQLTTSSRIDAWGGIISDGSRLYFLEREGDHWNLAQTSVSGGDSQVIAAPFRNTRIFDLSPDHSSFLIGSFIERGTLMPLWIWPVQGGPPKRVGDAFGYDAAWHPDGQRIVYSQDDGIYQVNADGTNAHKFLNMQGGRIANFAWSPDSRFLRFSLLTDQPWSSTLFQVDAEGTRSLRVPTHSSSSPDDCWGHWNSDGKYFFFRSGRLGTLDIWAVREEASLFSHSNPVLRLTAGPLDFQAYWPSSDGRVLFALAAHGRNELVRYSLQTHQVALFLPNLQIFSLAFSPDSHWIAFVRSSDYSLFRVRSDGTDLLPLSTLRLQGTAPAWSPDGRQIAFATLRPGQPSAVFLISVEGGALKQLPAESANQSEPAWSPDGKLLAFSRFDLSSSSRNEVDAIGIFDLDTGQTSVLPGSFGLRTPSWSPDGRRIAAFTEDVHKMMLFDRGTGQWTELASGTVLTGPPMWSKDGMFLFYQDKLAPNQPIYRVRIRDKKKELVVSFETLLRTGINRASLLAAAPDGSFIAGLDHTQSDIYALDLDTH